MSSLKPTDFTSFRSFLSEKYALASIRQAVISTKAIFNWGSENEICQQVNVGSDFKNPELKQMRRQVKERPSERFTAEEIRVTLEHAQQPFKAMLLVGI